MIQDIEPSIFRNEYSLKEQPEKQDYVLLFQDRNILIKKETQEQNLAFMTYQEYINCLEEERSSELIYLFQIDGVKYFLGDEIKLSEEFMHEKIKQNYVWVKMFETRKARNTEQVLAAATGWHLYRWYRRNRFCGCCGHKTIHAENERMLQCPACKNMIFPTIAPAVIVGVVWRDKILLTTYANREYKRYALIAGFTEIGESAEETVRREVMEEVGLPVKNITYYKSQPWGYDSNLLLGYFCEVDEEKLGNHGIVMDERELASAEWVTKAQVPDYKENLSLTHEMMRYWCETELMFE